MCALQSRQSTNPKDHCSPASLRVRLKMMPYFLKSTYAANCFPACVQVSVLIHLPEQAVLRLT